MAIKDKDNYEKAFEKASKESQAENMNETFTSTTKEPMKFDMITDGNSDETKPSFYPKRTRLKTMKRSDL